MNGKTSFLCVDNLFHALQFVVAKPASGWTNHKAHTLKITMTQMIKRKNKEQKPNNWHHSKKEESLEDNNSMDVENLAIYKESASPDISIRENEQ